MAGVLEVAITHRMGPQGQREVCERPSAIREMATRLHKWKAEAETCKSCLSLPAVRVIGGMAICGRCSQQRAQMVGDGIGLPVARHLRDDSGATMLSGLAIVFNSASLDLGGFTEYVKPAAIDRSLANGSDVLWLWNHDSNLPIGRRSAGTLDLVKRQTGLQADVVPPKWAHGHVESIDRRDVKGMSFGFVVRLDDWRVGDDDAIVRDLWDVDLHEVSGTAFPAYPATTLQVRNIAERTREAESAHRLRMAR
jgi:HK97 family phage prohead protease